jgi:hypothetical protein
MLVRLLINHTFVSLICAELGFDHRRPLKLNGLADMARRYAAAHESRDARSLTA